MPLTKRVYYLILVASLVRLFIGGMLELSNDEVYYYLYALNLQWNYFDHPPGVGLLIRLSTVNLAFTQELFVRLGAVVCAAAGTYFSFRIGSLLKNERTGWIAALFYTTSIYTSVIAGTFIIPDSPQVVFWLGALWIMYLIILQTEKGESVAISQWLLFGLLTGLAVLCKVHAIFLWLGFGLFILLYAPRMLKEYGLYLSALVTIIVMSPILWWNLENDFITYRFHSGRVAVQESLLHFDSFVQSVGGQILYNNPINVMVILIALWTVRKGTFLGTTATRFLVLNGLPIILVVCGMSLFNDMLPHWSGPGFMVLAFVGAAYLEQGTRASALVPNALKISGILIGTALVAAFLLIKFYPGTIGKQEAGRSGEDDFTLDMSGWAAFDQEFKPWLENQQAAGKIPAHIRLVSHKWFPAAHLDYYVARPSNLDLIGVGDLADLHHYYWLNKTRRDLQPGDSALCIIPSNYPVRFEETYLQHFASVDSLRSFSSFRGGSLARTFGVYRLNGFLMKDQVHDNGLLGK